DALRLERLPAREGEQALGELRGGVRAFQGRLNRLCELCREMGTILVAGLGELALDGIEIADDDGEKVVEVVSDAAGELADRLHLLRLLQCRLGLEAPLRFGLEF